MPGRLILVSGYTPDPVRQDYDYRAQATDAFDRCIRSKRERQARRLRNVTVTDVLPEAAKGVRGGWKKLAAIMAVATSASSGPDDLILWHDADAVPNADVEIVARSTRIARLQPSVAVWMQPGADLAAAFPAATWSAFEGVPLPQAGRRLATSNSLQSGVILIRAVHATAILSGVLAFYSSAAEAAGRLTAHLADLGVPAQLRGSQEQGPLAHHLVKSAPHRVRMVPWLQCEVRRGCDGGHFAPSFLHYAGCSFSTKRARKCLARYCDANASLDASWPKSRSQHRATAGGGGGASPFRLLRASGVTSEGRRRQCAERPGCCERHPRACAPPPSGTTAKAVR